MNKDAIFSHFSKIIDRMIENSLFFETFWCNPVSLDEAIEGNDDDAAIPSNVNIFFGATRGCILDDDYNYVAKFDILGDNLASSMCEREIEIYDAAADCGLEKYFVKPTYLGTYRKTVQFYDVDKIEQHIDWYDYNPVQFDEDFMAEEENFGPIIPVTIEVPLYVYPRIDRYKYTMLSEKEQELYRKQANSIDSPLRGRHTQIAQEFIFCYGMEEYQKLSDFMYDWYINDLHFGNLGSYRGNLCIFDYAGYHNGEEIDAYYDSSSQV